MYLEITVGLKTIHSHNTLFYSITVQILFSLFHRFLKNEGYISLVIFIRHIKRDIDFLAILVIYFCIKTLPLQLHPRILCFERAMVLLAFMVWCTN